MGADRKTRRRHGAQFKLEVLAACREPGASVAGIALAFGLNANLVRQWLRGRGLKRADDAVVQPAAEIVPTSRAQQFVALALPPAVAPSRQPEANLPAADIRVDMRRGDLQVSVSWPSSAAADCGAWLRELLR
jgi:transposase